MIELTVQEMIDSLPMLKELAGKQLKSKVAYKVARLLRDVQKESDIFDAARMKLINQYGQKDENNELIRDEKGNVYIQTEHIDDFNNELKDLLELRLTLANDKLKLDDLGDELWTPAQMLSFRVFLEE